MDIYEQKTRAFITMLLIWAIGLIASVVSAPFSSDGSLPAILFISALIAGMVIMIALYPKED